MLKRCAVVMCALLFAALPAAPLAAFAQTAPPLRDLGMLMIVTVWLLGRQMPTGGADNPHMTIWIASGLGNSRPKDSWQARCARHVA